MRVISLLWSMWNSPQSDGWFSVKQLWPDRILPSNIFSVEILFFRNNYYYAFTVFNAVAVFPEDRETPFILRGGGVEQMGWYGQQEDAGRWLYINTYSFMELNSIGIGLFTMKFKIGQIMRCFKIPRNRFLGMVISSRCCVMQISDKIMPKYLMSLNPCSPLQT